MPSLEPASTDDVVEDDVSASVDTPIVDPLDTSSGTVGETESVPTDPGAETSSPIGSNRKSALKVLGEGTILNGRYKILRKIGGGGMGAVYLASDLNLGGVERAVKEMVQSSIDEDSQAKAIEDFKRESMILTTLDHPAIPTIYDYFFEEAEARFYLVMKYISGGDLAGRLRAAPNGKIEERTVVDWATQISDVLAYLHGLPTTIVYRDLKPSNVMIDGKTGRVMLIDFGIARSINQEEKGVTAVGTMGYAPPELFSGQVEPRSDIYSLGSTMFHLLTGADPQNNPLLIFDFQKHPRPRQINPQLSDQMERILMRAVEYSADSRFSSADEMRQALKAHLENLRNGSVTYGVSNIPTAVSLSNQSVFCGFCGQRIVATDLFCAFCGAKQPIAQHGVHAEIYPRTGATARLVIDGTSELDVPAFSLEKNENLLGRRDPMSNIFPEVDLSRFDPQTKISRRHARIWRDGGAFLVEDLGSSNGTILIANRSDTLRLSPRTPHPLANGDRIRLGDTTLHFLMS
ncbi:MAG: FHA domain-containing serine/threonine-protein kinase [Pyrinomonadaceae bacterium]